MARDKKIRQTNKLRVVFAMSSEFVELKEYQQLHCRLTLYLFNLFQSKVTIPYNDGRNKNNTIFTTLHLPFYMESFNNLTRKFFFELKQRASLLNIMMWFLVGTTILRKTGYLKSGDNAFITSPMKGEEEKFPRSSCFYYIINNNSK